MCLSMQVEGKITIWMDFPWSAEKKMKRTLIDLFTFPLLSKQPTEKKLTIKDARIIMCQLKIDIYIQQFHTRGASA